MLYLPAFPFEDARINLPAFPRDVLEYCLCSVETDQESHSLRQIWIRSPGLLIFALYGFHESQSQIAESFESLEQWVSRFGFADSDLENAFQECAPFDSDGQHRFHRWTAKPSRKRLERFLCAVTGIETTQARRLIRTVFAPSLIKELQDETRVDASLPETTGKHSEDSQSFAKLWRLSAQWQNLKNQFNEVVHQKKMAAMKQLAYGASHEINNPLANIATRAQSLIRDEPNPSRRDRLAVIYAQSIRAHEMISDMMLFAHPPEIEVERVDVHAIASQIAAELQSECNRAQIKIRIRQYPNVPSFRADPTQFSVAIKALIQNAMHAIGMGGTITIQIWPEDQNHVGVAVCDTGGGIDATQSSRVFDPFYSGREAGRGLGFGLSKAWRIVEMHGGVISVDSQETLGARIVMRFPCQPSTKSTIPGPCRIDNVRAA